MLKAIKKSISRGLKRHAFNFISLETPVDKSVFLTKTGGLVTVYEYLGFSSLIGDTELKNHMEDLKDYLETVFSRPGTTLTIVNDINDNLTKSYISKAVANQRETAKRLGLDLDDVIESDVDEISNFVTYDRIFICLWSDVQVYGEEDRKRITGAKAEREKAHLLESQVTAPLIDTVNTNTFVTDLLDSHQASAQLLENTLNKIDSRFNRLDCSTAAKELKLQIEPGTTSHYYNPVLINDEYMPRSQDGNDDGEAKDDALPPRLDRQIARLLHEDADGFSKVGSTYYASMYVDFYPRKLRMYNLLRKALPKHVPTRITMILSHGQAARIGINEILSQFVFFAHSDNSVIKESVQKLRKNAEEEGNLKLQMVVTSTAEDVVTLKRNRQSIMAAFSEWGNAQLVLDVVDPKELFIASAVGGASKIPIEAGHPSVSDMSFMLPLYHPASQWDTGSILFTTRSGRLMPFEPMSSKQESYATAMVANPRQGKSVLANAILTALTTKGGLIRLPRIAALDIGNSTAGFINLLKDNLPHDQKHLVHTFEWQKSARQRKNIFDVQLGADKPLPFERSQIVNILLMMVTDPGVTPREGMADLASAAVDCAYEYTAERQNARRYAYGEAPAIDKALSALDMKIVPNKTTYKYIRDEFFKRNMIREAKLAQRMIVPTLNELPTIISKADMLQRSYGDGSSFNVLGTFITKLESALRRFPNLSGYTNIDFDVARIINVDLTQVAPKGETGEALKDTSVMYSVAALAIAGDFFLGVDYVSYYPEQYQYYHSQRIEELSEDEKLIQFDELHRPIASPIVASMIEQYILEGPKYKVGIHLISQKVKHFKGLLSLMTNIFFLGTPSADELKHIKEMVNLTESELAAFKSGEIHGPKRGGSSFLHRMKTQDGTYSQVLRFPKGAKSLWALGTSGDDQKIRRLLTERFGGSKARAMLSAGYPQATIKHEVERRRELMGDDDITGESKSIIAQIYDDLVNQYGDAR